jgi:hypothetical protein
MHRNQKQATWGQFLFCTLITVVFTSFSVLPLLSSYTRHKPQGELGLPTPMIILLAPLVAELPALRPESHQAGRHRAGFLRAES